MRVWIDALTPKQILFSEQIIARLSGHKILCTTRKYREVTKLVKTRNIKAVQIGRHGGIEKESKLEASLSRMKQLEPIIRKFSPDITISFCSPDAARISYGLGIRHVAFCDSPHATAVMKLTVPLIQKLFIPWIIPKKEFTKFGIDKSDIIQYKAIDASVLIKREVEQIKKSGITLLVRIEEEEASYASRSNKIIPIINEISDRIDGLNIIVLGRYEKQIKRLQRHLGSKVSVLKTPVDGKALLQNANVFIGSGGTMTAESALMGIPTISYHAVPNIVEDFLVKEKLVKLETNPRKIAGLISSILVLQNILTVKTHARIAMKLLNKMEDPISVLIKEELS